MFVAPYIKGSYFRTEGSDWWYVQEYGYYDVDDVWIEEDGFYGSYSKEVNNIQGGLLMGVQMLIGNIISL